MVHHLDIDFWILNQRFLCVISWYLLFYVIIVLFGVVICCYLDKDK